MGDDGKVYGFSEASALRRTNAPWHRDTVLRVLLRSHIAIRFLQ
jgi:hypothetical protein